MERALRKADGVMKVLRVRARRPLFDLIVGALKRVHRRTLFWLLHPFAIELTRQGQVLDRLTSDLRPTVFTNPAVRPAPKSTFDYVGFEEVFRGTGAMLKDRLRIYVDLFRDRTLIVDVGCGRGEFLELLRGAGVIAQGVDTDPGMVETCRRKGLHVAHGDFEDYLCSTPDGSLGGVFSSQFIEHLAPDRIDVFVKMAYRKLGVGGIFVAETVNPYHLANFRFFWVDPTHQKPIFPEVARFFCWSAGFDQVDIRFVPCFGETCTDLQEPWDFCDYAVVAVKTADRARSP